MQCPKCASTDQLRMENGTFLCLDCRHEHDGKQAAPVDADSNAEPSPLVPPSDDVSAILQAATAADVLSAPLVSHDAPLVVETHDGADGTPNLAGRFLHVRGYVDTMLCTEDDGGDTITCVDVDDFTRTIARSDVAAAEFGGPDPLAPVVGAQTVSEDQPFDPIIFTVAALALTQGAACVGDDGETLYNPRIGWLPPPCDQVPEAEQGVAYAIAVLIVTFGLDKDSVAQIAATLMQGAEVPGMETVQ